MSGIPTRQSTSAYKNTQQNLEKERLGFMIPAPDSAQSALHWSCVPKIEIGGQAVLFSMAPTMTLATRRRNVRFRCHVDHPNKASRWDIPECYIRKNRTSTTAAPPTMTAPPPPPLAIRTSASKALVGLVYFVHWSGGLPLLQSQAQGVPRELHCCLHLYVVACSSSSYH